MVSVNSIKYGTLAIKVGLVFNFAVVFSSTYFLFRQVHTNYWVIGMSIGKVRQTGSSYYNLPVVMHPPPLVMAP